MLPPYACILNDEGPPLHAMVAVGVKTKEVEPGTTVDFIQCKNSYRSESGILIISIASGYESRVI